MSRALFLGKKASKKTRHKCGHTWVTQVLPVVFLGFFCFCCLGLSRLVDKRHETRKARHPFFDGNDFFVEMGKRPFFELFTLFFFGELAKH